MTEDEHKAYVDRRLEEFDRWLVRWLNERFTAQQEAIRVLVEANQRSFDEAGRRLVWFGLGLVLVQIAVSIVFKVAWK